MAEPEWAWRRYLSTAPKAACETLPRTAELPSWYRRAVAIARLAG